MSASSHVRIPFLSISLTVTSLSTINAPSLSFANSPATLTVIWITASSAGVTSPSPASNASVSSVLSVPSENASTLSESSSSSSSTLTSALSSSASSTSISASEVSSASLTATSAESSSPASAEVSTSISEKSSSAAYALEGIIVTVIMAAMETADKRFSTSFFFTLLLLFC